MKLYYSRLQSQEYSYSSFCLPLFVEHIEYDRVGTGNYKQQLKQIENESVVGQTFNLVCKRVRIQIRNVAAADAVHYFDLLKFFE